MTDAEPGPRELLRAATIALVVDDGAGGRAEGTGFFVAPGVVATCAHVLARIRSELPSRAYGRLTGARRDLELTIRPDWYLRERPGGLDLAFLSAPEAPDVPFVLLSGAAWADDRMWTFGHPAGQFRAGQPAAFVCHGRSRRLDEPGLPAVEGWEPLRVTGTPVGGGYSGSAVLNTRTGAVAGMLCSSNKAGSAHLVSADDIVSALARLEIETMGLAGHVEWLQTLSDAQIWAGGWPFPGPDLRAYLDAAARAAREHPFPGVLPGTVRPPLVTVYLRQLACRESVPAARDGLAGQIEVAGPIPATTVFEMDQNCVVVGGPGAGKSSLMRIGLMDSVHRWQSGAVTAEVPVRVQAVDLVASRPLPQAIAESVQADLSAVGLLKSWPPEFFEDEPMRGVRWLVLVDGLDEIIDLRARRTVLGKLTGIAMGVRPSPYRFVVATRPLVSDELDWAGWSSRYELQTFAMDDLGRFAESWFTVLGLADPERASSAFTGRLRRMGIVELARSPLMATMLCQLYAADPGRGLPAGRAGVYRDFVALLYERARNADASGVYAQMRATLDRYGSTAVHAGERVLDSAQRLIARLAAVRLSDTTDSAVDLLFAWTSTLRPQHVPATAWAAFLREVLRRSGLLTERGGDMVFLHRTIVEYLAAVHVVADDHADAVRPVGSRWTGPRAQPRQDLTVAFDDLFGRWEYMFSKRTGWRPTGDGSFNGFLIDIWYGTDDEKAHAALSATLGRLATDGGLEGCAFIAERVVEGTQLPAAIAATAISTLAALAFDRTQDAWHGHTWYRHRAAQALVGLGDARGADALAALAVDRSVIPEDRHRAAQALADLGDARGADALAALAVDRFVYSIRSGEYDRHLAAEALIRLGDARGIEALAARAAEPSRDGFRSHQAAKRLVQLGDARGVDALAAQAADSNLEGFSRCLVADDLADLGDQRGIDLLAALAADSTLKYSDRLWAAKNLVRHDELRGIDLLAAFAARSFDYMARWRAFDELKEHGKRAADALAVLAADRDLSGFERGKAAEELIRLQDTRGVDLLAALAADPAPLGKGRRRAIDTLIGVGYAQGIDLLAALAADQSSDGYDRYHAAKELVRIGDARGIDLLATLAVDPALYRSLHYQAAQELARLGDPRGAELIARLDTAP